jgi:hypothetical protein
MALSDLLKLADPHGPTSRNGTVRRTRTGLHLAQVSDSPQDQTVVAIMRPAVVGLLPAVGVGTIRWDPSVRHMRSACVTI